MSETSVALNAVERGVKTASNTLNKLIGSQEAVPIAVKQQVDRFLALDDAGKQAIIAARGQAEYERYARIMLAKSREIYHA
jgi:hypothetical protein